MATSGRNLTRIVAQSCTGTDFSSLSAEVVDRSRYLLLDFLGCAIRGTVSDSSAPVLRLVQRKCSADEQVPIIGTGLKSEGSFAALAVGTAAHSLELDDVVNSASLHPAVAVIPAAQGETPMHDSTTGDRPTTYAQASGLIESEVDGETVLMSIDDGQYHSLEGLGRVHS